MAILVQNSEYDIAISYKVVNPDLYGLLATMKLTEEAYDTKFKSIESFILFMTDTQQSQNRSHK